jgi:hypothetical protein
MKEWKLYRNGSMTLEQRITVALEHYSVHNGGRLPAGIKVNPRDVAEATKVVADMGLALSVVGNGGALVGEVWLLICTEGGEQ